MNWSSLDQSILSCWFSKTKKFVNKINFLSFLSSINPQTFCAMECPEEHPYTDRSIYCVANCSENQFVNKDDNRCAPCHRECLGGCDDDRRSSCFQCKNVQYDTECLALCPEGFQNNSGVCMEDPNSRPTNRPNGYADFYFLI